MSLGNGTTTFAQANYAWNGENRLIAMENQTTGVCIEADYDYMSRRLHKKVYTNNILTRHTKFAYDGYKLIAEFDTLNNDTQTASNLWLPTSVDVPLLRSGKYFVSDGNKTPSSRCSLGIWNIERDEYWSRKSVYL